MKKLNQLIQRIILKIEYELNMDSLSIIFGIFIGMIIGATLSYLVLFLH